MDSPIPNPVATQKPLTGPSEGRKNSGPAHGLPDKDEPKRATPRNPCPEEVFQAYQLGGLCPIELESLVHERYRILDKMDYSHRCTSWIARDQSSSELVQLAIFSDEFSEKAADSDHAEHYRKFLESSSKSSDFQSCLNELWIESANGHHFCRVLEFGVLNVAEWQTYSDVGCFSAGDCRNLISTLLHGLCELHDQGFIHSCLDIHCLIFTSTEANTLSHGQLRELLGNPNIKTRDPFETEPGYNLPRAVVFSNSLEPFIKFNRQARLRAFPLLGCPPETMYKHNLRREASWDIWAAGCMIFEIVTGMPLFVVGPDRACLLSHMQDILGDIPEEFRREWDIPYGDLNWILPFWPFKRQYPRLEPLSQRIRQRLSALISTSTPLEQAIPVFSDEEHALLVDLLTKMLQYDPSKRITAKEALNHPFFSFKPEQS